MRNPLTTIIVLAFPVFGLAGASTQPVAPVPWDLEALRRPPAVHPAPEQQAEGVRGLFYEALPWKGKPTRVFAWYGVPPDREAGKRLPAMVLAHGGGGTAFAEWVRLWNQRGYAAIAMDLEGTLPEGEYPDRPHHAWSGPMRAGAFEDLDRPVQEQWMYHAVADIILANSLLRSFPEIDADRIGLTGISWGGILSCVVAGVDHRFRLAIPVYGCGFLDDAPIFRQLWDARGPEAVRTWKRLWDPARYLPRAELPMLWVNGTNDRHFPLSVYRRSIELAPGPCTLCIRVGMKHAHPPGWEPEEIYAFADSILRDGVPLARIRDHGCDGRQCWLTFESAVPVERAELISTNDTSDWVACRWDTSDAAVDAAAERVTATLPAGTRAYFVNLIDTRGMVVSSRMETVAEE